MDNLFKDFLQVPVSPVFLQPGGILGKGMGGLVCVFCLVCQGEALLDKAYVQFFPLGIVHSFLEILQQQSVVSGNVFQVLDKRPVAGFLYQILKLSEGFYQLLVFQGGDAGCIAVCKYTHLFLGVF